MRLSVLHLAELEVRSQTEGIHICSLSEGINTTPGCNLICHVFAAVVECRRDIIVENHCTRLKPRESTASRSNDRCSEKRHRWQNDPPHASEGIQGLVTTNARGTVSNVDGRIVNTVDDTDLSAHLAAVKELQWGGFQLQEADPQGYQ
jgi:hypothetical protein